MKILVTGNHTCGNRGDAAILRGLISHISKALPSADVDVTSRYPVSSEYLLGREVIPDPLYSLQLSKRRKLPGKLDHYRRSKMIPLAMAQLVNGRTGMKRIIPSEILDVAGSFKQYDRVIQVGGSFFVDLYGMRQFETAFAAMIAKTPVSVLGHSMGPFGGRTYQRLVSTLLDNADGVFLRESVTLDMMRMSGIETATVRSGADTAWLVDPASSTDNFLANLPLNDQSRYVAITMRDLAPFDKRLGVSQSQYEEAFSKLADSVIDKGYEIVACSTCTGIDSYHRDDRMPALRVKKLVRNKSRFHVIMNELNDVQLGHLLSKCELLVGTRLHSVIISMNFGTPAIAINYEHKSAGILAQVGLPELSSSISELIDGRLRNKVIATLADVGSLRRAIVPAIDAERVRARNMVDEALGCSA